MFKVFGIRHHGPGSSRSMLRALEAYEPDHILIEAPQDAEPVLQYMLHPDLIPPVAILMYDDKDLSKASYLPFAHFSPEWLAAQFGLAQGCTVQFMDLPMSMQFQLKERKKQELEFTPANTEEGPIIKDPMGYIARMAGYSDSERWWEATFEQTDNDEQIFEAIISLNTALRDELGRRETPLTQMREAYMRKVLRKAIKDKAGRIAIICGAWHAPALHYLDRYTQKKDNAILKGLKKRKARATWIPWSYEQLAFQSGYRAGVVSPAWYELLFDEREDATTHWMAKVAGLLREEGLEASAAHAVEATRLATTLAALRQQPIAGLPEMKEAAISIFCNGRDEPWQLIESRLVVGQKVGEVSPDIPQAALQTDMEARIRTARLTKYYNTGAADTKELDLRKPTNLEGSHLLHQLRILDIPWGTTLEGTGNELGSFKEYWRLHWKPDFIIRLIQAGMLGNTVRAAAAQKLLNRATEEEAVEQLVQLASAALVGGLPEVFTPLTKRLEDAAALTKDIFNLMEALPVLVNIIRYGDARQTDVQSVETLIDQLIPRIAVGLPSAVMNIDEELSRSWFELMVRNNHSIALLNNHDYTQEWNQSLQQLMNNGSASVLLRGLACRMLFDKSLIAVEDVSRQMSFILSSLDSLADAAYWLEGFLHGSGLLLVHHPTLLNVLDSWVTDISEDNFNEVLPVLRRSFSNFTGPERAKLLSFTRQRQSAQTAERESDVPYDQQRAKAALPTLKLLLGLE